MIRVQPAQAPQASASYLAGCGRAVQKSDLYLATWRLGRELRARERGFASVAELDAAEEKEFADKLFGESK